MFRVKLMSSAFPIIRNYVFKFYSSAVEKSAETLYLSEAIGAKKGTNSEPGTNNSIPLVSKAASGTEKGSCGSRKVVGGESSDNKRGGNCKKGHGGTKGKKGKMCYKSKTPTKPGPTGDNFVEDKCDMFETHKPNVKKWRSLSYALVPLVLGLSAFILATRGEHLEPNYIPYEYMYRRTKRFPWRDGRTALFHGPNNLIPDEEEDRIARENEENPAQREGQVKYKKHVNEEEEKFQKREEHAKDELERRKKRHEQEQDN